MVLGSAGYRCSFFRFKLFVLHEYRLLKDNKLLCARLTIGTWAALCGVFAIFCSAVFYGAYGKKHGWSARRAGLYLNLEQLWKTIALAVIVIVVSVWPCFCSTLFLPS